MSLFPTKEKNARKKEKKKKKKCQGFEIFGGRIK